MPRCSLTSANQYKSHWIISMKLRRNEYCPIHRSLFCCGRQQHPKERRLRLGVQRIEDPHHPRGYRELRSPAEMRKLMNRKIVEQDGKCAICHESFTDYNDIVPEHKEPKGMGSAWRDDHPEQCAGSTSVVQPSEGLEKITFQPRLLIVHCASVFAGHEAARHSVVPVTSRK